MALPRTITGLTLPGQAQISGAFRSSTGDHYIAAGGGGADHVMIHKADNGDNTWSEQDSGNAPTTDTEVVGACLVSDVIYVASISVSNVLYYHEFDCS